MDDKRELDSKVDQDIAGVQGAEPAERDPTPPDAAALDQGAKVVAPDAGEIEWAGALVKKAPRSPDPAG